MGIEEDAMRLAHDMTTTEQWLTCEAHAVRDAPSLGRMDPELARATLAYRDRAVAGLSKSQATLLARLPSLPCDGMLVKGPRITSAEILTMRSLARQTGPRHWGRTDFGREVARVLEGGE